MGEKKRYVTVSIPNGIAQEIDKLIKELRYWPSKSAFVREACLEKIRKERQKLETSRATGAGTEQPLQDEESCRGTNPGISPRETAPQERSTKAPQDKR